MIARMDRASFVALCQKPNATLFNCCTDFMAPLFGEFVVFEVQGCCDHDGATFVVDEAHDADFWTVYGRRLNGEALAITDVSTPAMANRLADLFRWYLAR